MVLGFCTYVWRYYPSTVCINVTLKGQKAASVVSLGNAARLMLRLENGILGEPSLLFRLAKMTGTLRHPMDSVCNIADGVDSDLTMCHSAAVNVGHFKKGCPRGSTRGTRDESYFDRHFHVLAPAAGDCRGLVGLSTASTGDGQGTAAKSCTCLGFSPPPPSCLQG